MQIAGDIPAHVMYVNFRNSDTYIRNKFLYPLDKYIEEMLGQDVTNGQNMELDEYLAELANSGKYKIEIEIPLHLRDEVHAKYVDVWDESMG